MLSNIELKDKKLYYVLNEPFKGIVEQSASAKNTSDSKVWQGVSESNASRLVLETGPRPAHPPELITNYDQCTLFCFFVLGMLLAG